MRKPTIYECLKEKLGREPTHRELCADVERILGSVDRAAKKALSNYKKPEQLRVIKSESAKYLFIGFQKGYDTACLRVTRYPFHSGLRVTVKEAHSERLTRDIHCRNVFLAYREASKEIKRLRGKYV